MKKSKKVRHLFEYTIINILYYGLRVLPFALRVKLGGAVLAQIIRRSRKFRMRIQENLKLVFPEMSPKQRERIRLSVGKTFGRTFMEVLNSDSYAKHQDLFHISGPGLQALKDAQAEGRGAILVSGHFGQSGAIRTYLAKNGIEVAAFYHPSANTYFDRLYLKQIKFAGRYIFPTGRRGSLNLTRHIIGGGVVLLLLDQRYVKGEVLDFLGQPAATSTSMADIAIKYNLPFIPVYGTRHEDSLEVDVDFEQPIPHTDATTMTQLANDSLSARVRKSPGQWYWLHKRWG